MKKRNRLNTEGNCFPILVCEFQVTSRDTNIQIITEDEKIFNVPSISAFHNNFGIVGFYKF
jgi:hypothetical protein